MMDQRCAARPASYAQPRLTRARARLLRTSAVHALHGVPFWLPSPPPPSPSPSSVLAAVEAVTVMRTCSQQQALMHAVATRWKQRRAAASRDLHDPPALRRAGWRGSLGHLGGKLHRLLALFTGSKHGLVGCRHGRVASTFAPRHTCWRRYSSRCRRHQPRMLLETLTRSFHLRRRCGPLGSTLPLYLTSHMSCGPRATRHRPDDD